MIEDLMADSKRWDEELRRSRNNRGTRPGRNGHHVVSLAKDLISLQLMQIPRFMNADKSLVLAAKHLDIQDSNRR